MALGWFLIGLCVGLLLLGWHRLHLSRKFQQLARHLNPQVVHGAIDSSSGLARAIAEQNKAFYQLERELAVWQQICQAAPIGFLYIDGDNQLIHCNARACQLLVLRQGNLEFPRLLMERVRSYELNQLIEQTRNTQQPGRCEWTFHPVCVDPDRPFQPHERLLRAYSYPLPNDMVGVFLEDRQEISLLTQQRDRWTSDVAHELKTPLTSIRLVAETLQSRLDPPLRDWISRLLQEVVRLNHLVQDLLDLSYLESATDLQLQFKTIDLAGLVQAAWISLEPLARQKQLRLDYQGPPQLLIKADEARMHRALLNLLDNSIKFSPPDSSILVRLSVLPDHLQRGLCPIHLEVIDCGPGFSESTLPYIFDRFYRGDLSRTRHTNHRSLSTLPPEGYQGDHAAQLQTHSPVPSTTAGSLSATTDAEAPLTSGSGLGLAIVRQIVEAHAGYVQASNHPETQGAWLEVFLPQSHGGMTD